MANPMMRHQSHDVREIVRLFARRRGGRHQLFDLQADPNEQHDLSAERSEKLTELQAALAAHNAEQAEPAWASQISVPINIDKDLTQADAPDDEYIYWSN